MKRSLAIIGILISLVFVNTALADKSLSDVPNPNIVSKWLSISNTGSINGFHVSTYYNNTKNNKNLKMAVLYSIPLGITTAGYQFGILAFSMFSDKLKVKHYLYDLENDKYNEVKELSEAIILVELMKSIEKNKPKEQDKSLEPINKTIAGVIQ